MDFQGKNRRLMRLLDWLHRIQYPTSVHELEVAMHEFTHELLQVRVPGESLNDDQDFVLTSGGQVSSSDHVAIFVRGDETILNELESKGVISIVLQSMRHCLMLVDSSYNINNDYYGDNRFVISPHFFNSACIALVHLCFQSQSRTLLAYQNGGFDTLVDVMHTYRSIDFVQIICIAGLMIIGRNNNNDHIAHVSINYDIETIILREIVFAMETHHTNPKLYTVACSAMGSLFGLGLSSVSSSTTMNSTTYIHHHHQQYHHHPPTQCRSQFDDDWYHRALSAICYGIIFHADDDGATMVGNTLLADIVGPEVATEMVLEVEEAHGAVQCAAAA